MNRLVLVESVARAAAAAIGIGILEAAAFAAVVLVLARVSRPSATTRHVLWWIVLAAGAALPLASIAGSLGRIEHRSPAVASTAAREFGAVDDGATTATVKPRVPRIAPHRSSAAALPAKAAAESSPLPPITNGIARALFALPYLASAAVAVWLAVAVAGLGLLGSSLLGLSAIKRAALPLDESVVRRLRRWRHSTRLGRAVDLKVSNEVDVPVAVGFRTPTILLPARVVETEEIADLDQIAMHEYAHLDRYDDWTNLLQRILERIFWFNPVVLLVGRQISLEREIACDDWVIAQTGRAHRYATCLWKLVESARLPAKPIVAPGALLSPKQITTRIEQLLDSRRNALPRLSPLGAIALGTLGVALAIVQAQRAPVIAVEDVPAVPSPAVAAHHPEPGILAPALPAMLPEPAPAARAHAAASPAPAVRPETIVVRVAEDATPRAIATEVARILSEHDHTVVKATIERAIHRSLDAGIDKTVASASAAGERLGLDIAKTVASTVTSGLAGAAWDRQSSKLDRETIAQCFGCNLRGRDLRGIDLHGIALTGDDLRGADLRGVDLQGAKLVGIDLRRAKLDGANLSNAALNGCDLREASLANANLDGLHLTGTSIRGTVLGNTHLRTIVDHCMGCDLRGLDLHGQDLHGIELYGADLRGADLRDANLSHARLQGVDLRGARLSGADLTGAELTGCNMSGTALDGAKTQGMTTNDVGFDAESPRLHTASNRLHADFQRFAALKSLSYLHALSGLRWCKLLGLTSS